MQKKQKDEAKVSKGGKGNMRWATRWRIANNGEMGSKKGKRGKVEAVSHHGEHGPMCPVWGKWGCDAQ